MAIDWEALEAAGVYDPSAPLADQRRELLEYFDEVGASTESIVGAHEAGMLLSVASDHLATHPEAFTIDELAARASFPIAIVEDLYAVLGVPVLDRTEALFIEADVRFLEQIADGPASIFEVSELAEMLRVFGASLARMSDVAVSTFMSSVERRLVEMGATEAELAKTGVAANEQALRIPDVLGAVLRHHFRASIRRLTDASNAAGGDGFRVAIGFIDVVGFTTLSATLDADALGELVATFENRTSDIITRCGGQVMKHLGDEVMFLAVDPVTACEIAHQLVDDFAQQGIEPHGGLTLGDAVTRRGDYYGPAVNLASRLVNHAVPGEVLVNQDLVDAVGDSDRFTFAPAGRRMVRGFADPVTVFSLERPTP
jgi:adenylate cyclase